MIQITEEELNDKKRKAFNKLRSLDKYNDVSDDLLMEMTDIFYGLEIKYGFIAILNKPL